MFHSFFSKPVNYHKIICLSIFGVLFGATLSRAQTPSKDCIQSPFDQQNKTVFQISDAWDARYDVRGDAVMVYGINDAGGHFEQRVAGWREKGYNVQFMTGSAWGQYKDYFLGKYDGKKHFDQGQTMKNGDIIWHGENVPYVVPTDDYLNYLKTHIKRAIDAGVTAIYLEEPEFWARAGYSPAFKKLWADFYHAPWQPQDSSAEATYLSSKLKYHLYYKALDSLFTYAKAYSRSKGQEVACLVPTHSLINYSSWQIVSPEASLASLKNVDGYIAQIWTGTSREPVYYNGQKKERVFENAFLEYGSMVSMTAPTHRKIYFLTDPIEDRARTWDDYKKNYQATFTAQLMYPEVNNYEIMPWPSRIYLGKFKVEGSEKRQPIAPQYATQMQIMVNALQQMPATHTQVSGSKGIGVLVGNSMMFQRFPTHAGYEDPQLSNFYGMALPLLEKGVPVETVHMENLGYPETLANIQVLAMSYANMKPQREITHTRLAKWVKAGGTLVYYGKDQDPFQQVKEWWNTNGKHYPTPAAALFETMGIKETAASGKNAYPVGKGFVYIVRQDPKELVMNKGGDAAYLKLLQTAYQRSALVGSAGGTKQPLTFQNYFRLKRGFYVIASVLKESISQEPLEIKGDYINLFDADLPVVHDYKLTAGHQALLFDLHALHSHKPRVLAVAGRVYDSSYTPQKRTFTFNTKGPLGTNNSMRIYLPSKPATLVLTSAGEKLSPVINKWDRASHTLLLQYPHQKNAVDVALGW